MTDRLLLLSGNDIPFPVARLTVHPPKIKEIAYVTQTRFWQGCELLKFDKKSIQLKDKIDLSKQSNFNIIMSMIQEKHQESFQAKVNVLSVLALVFPTYEIFLGKDNIRLVDTETQQDSEINSDNFQTFKEILTDMFCLTNQENKQYNPSGDLAQKIANKIMLGRQKRAELSPKIEQIEILSRYISILAVGQNKDINELMNYTVYQLMEEFSRFTLKLHFDSWTQYRIAGATGMQTPEDWLKDIHSKENKNYIQI